MPAMESTWPFRRFPARESRWRVCCPLEASMGAMPFQEAKWPRLGKRVTSPTSARIRAAPARAAAFARDVIAQVAPEGKERAKNLLWAAGKLAGYAIPLGLEPVLEVMLHPSVAERFTRGAAGLSGQDSSRANGCAPAWPLAS